MVSVNADGGLLSAARRCARARRRRRRRRVRRIRRVVAVGGALAGLLGLDLGGGAVGLLTAVPELTQTYSAPLRTAVADLPVAPEDRTGYARGKFRHWVDADSDGCSTRVEVLIAEADDPVEVGADCDLTGGRWFSYYDAVSWTDPTDLDIDHMVPLAEAWDSGARDWAADERTRYANDLGDTRALVGVTASVNRSKADQDPAEWLPVRARCRYLREWVAVKHRWRLSVDAAEQTALTDLAATCDNLTITLTRAR